MRRRVAQSGHVVDPEPREWMPALPWPISEDSVAESVALVNAACQGSHKGRSGLHSALTRICVSAGFEVGHVYLGCTAAGWIRPSRIWYLRPPTSRFADFLRTTAGTTLVPGQGLPGQVVCSNAPVFLHPLVASSHMPRAKAALTAGLTAACGYPLKVNRELTLVLEFLAIGPIQQAAELDALVERLGALMLPHLRDLDAEDLL